MDHTVKLIITQVNLSARSNFETKMTDRRIIVLLMYNLKHLFFVYIKAFSFLFRIRCSKRKN